MLCSCLFSWLADCRYLANHHHLRFFIGPVVLLNNPDANRLSSRPGYTTLSGISIVSHHSFRSFASAAGECSAHAFKKLSIRFSSRPLSFICLSLRQPQDDGTLRWQAGCISTRSRYDLSESSFLDHAFWLWIVD